MGRPRVSEGLKALRGTSRPDRARKATAPLGGTGGPAPAPAHLRGEGKALWDAVTAEFQYSADLLNLLAAACEMRDLYSRARRQVELEGLTVTNAAGVMRPHPAAAIGRDALVQCRTLLGQLGVRGSGGDDA